MINELGKRIRTSKWVGRIGSFIFTYLFLLLISIVSPQTRSIICVILGILSLALGLIVFISIGKRLVIMLAPERVTAHFDSYHCVKNYSLIEYHYSYRGAEYTGKGCAADFDELTSPNTPFTLCISRINPNFSYLGDPRVGLIPPLLLLAIMVACSIIFLFLAPNERFHEAPITLQHSEHIKPIEWNVHGLHISATGMKGVPKGFKGFALPTSRGQVTTLHIENHSHAPIQIDRVQHDGADMPSWYVPPGGHCDGPLVPPGGHCDEQLFPPIYWRFMSGTTVLGILVSTPQAGYVIIRDTQ